jgi:hypothetical protein
LAHRKTEKTLKNFRLKEPDSSYTDNLKTRLKSEIPRSAPAASNSSYRIAYVNAFLILIIITLFTVQIFIPLDNTNSYIVCNEQNVENVQEDLLYKELRGYLGINYIRRFRFLYGRELDLVLPFYDLDELYKEVEV